MGEEAREGEVRQDNKCARKSTRFAYDGRRKRESFNPSSPGRGRKEINHS